MEIIKITDYFSKIREAVTEREATLKKQYLKRVEDTFEYFNRDKLKISNAFN